MLPRSRYITFPAHSLPLIIYFTSDVCVCVRTDMRVLITGRPEKVLNVLLLLYTLFTWQGCSCLLNPELGWWSVSPGVPRVFAYSQCYSYSHMIIYIQVFTGVLVIWTWIFACTAGAFTCWVILICPFATVSCYAEHDDVKLRVILLLQPSKCWIIVMHHFA